MADTGIFATTLEVQRKAGANASSVSNVEAYINDFMTQAESIINAITGYNWSDAYSGLNVDVKGLLKSAAACHAAIEVIRYDMSGFTLQTEAQNMITSLKLTFDEAIKELRVIKTRDFVVSS